MRAHTELDHLAIAAPDIGDLFPRYAGDLAGGWVGMGPDPDFSFARVRFGNGTRLELLEPRGDTEDDYLSRFLDRGGPGPHHLTFMASDLETTLGTLDEAGYHAVRVNGDDHEWRRAVLRADDGTGVIVQIAEDHPGTP